MNQQNGEFMAVGWSLFSGWGCRQIGIAAVRIPSGCGATSAIHVLSPAKGNTGR